jgi:hypothetical protein
MRETCIWNGKKKANFSTKVLKGNIVGRHSPRREYKNLLNPKQTDKRFRADSASER